MNLKLLFKRHLLCALGLLCANVLTSQNLLDTSTWTVGQGSVNGFSVNGSALENIRENGFNHVGEPVVLWKAIPDANNDADGGWNTSYHAIDNTKTYRFSVWIKNENSFDGRTYFGCQQWSSVPSRNILNLSGAYQPNPYFWNGDLPQLERWYLLVGFIHHKDYSTNDSVGGIYDGVTGELLQNITDFKFDPATTEIRHRAYLYYDVNTNDRQYFWEPRIDLIDGNEPTIEELLRINPDSKLLFTFDNAGNQKQRFYCDSPGCPIPNPPAGRAAPEKEEVVVALEKTAKEDDDPLDMQLVLYPNPTSGLVSLTLNSSSDVKLSDDIKIYNNTGILVKKLPSDGKNKQEIDFTNLSSGMYLIHIHFSNGTSITKQIIKN